MQPRSTPSTREQRLKQRNAAKMGVEKKTPQQPQQPQQPEEPHIRLLFGALSTSLMHQRLLDGARACAGCPSVAYDGRNLCCICEPNEDATKDAYERVSAAVGDGNFFRFDLVHDGNLYKLDARSCDNSGYCCNVTIRNAGDNDLLLFCSPECEERRRVKPRLFYERAARQGTGEFADDENSDEE